MYYISIVLLLIVFVNAAKAEDSSLAAKVLTVNRCGPNDGILVLRPNKEMTNSDKVARLEDLDTFLRDLPSRKHGTLKNAVLNGAEEFMIRVPTGTTPVVATKLRNSKIFSFVDLPLDPCGSAQQRFNNYRFGSAEQADLVLYSEDALVEIVEALFDVLKAESNAHVKSEAVEMEVISTKSNPEYQTSSVDFSVALPSETTRGKNGFWDRIEFGITIFRSITANTSELTFSISTYNSLTRVRTSTDKIPTKNHFVDSLRIRDEIVLNKRLVSQLDTAIRNFVETH
ncbi:hypothetical protein [Hoeflea prorocentri]|uniref:Uncharacterized protein n=1 Tax=Hoeflea prorocentri TaxID=1922333 RepID=A0A9X3UMI2_9HYPH|nr:hypothetical protein [Hoeflea prorocentri]MCY6383276.1 hypothetical protein [Hoeflea prorocentri]MDA5401076.1 hypothetical protein [Hoeflea prorocentri]